MNYVPNHSWGHADSEYVLCVWWTVREPSLLITNLQILSYRAYISTEGSTNRNSKQNKNQTKMRVSFKFFLDTFCKFGDES